MFFAKFNINGQETAQLYESWEQFHSDTFSPDTNLITLIEFVVHGKDYYSKKDSVRNLAINWSNSDLSGISWGEIATVQNWFYKNGKRYGFLEEFTENGLC